MAVPEPFDAADPSLDDGQRGSYRQKGKGEPIPLTTLIHRPIIYIACVSNSSIT